MCPLAGSCQSRQRARTCAGTTGARRARKANARPTLSFQSSDVSTSDRRHDERNVRDSHVAAAVVRLRSLGPYGSGWMETKQCGSAPGISICGEGLGSCPRRLRRKQCRMLRT